MLEMLWSLARAEFTVSVLFFCVMMLLFIVTIIITTVLYSITRVALNSKLAKWAKKHVNITVAKD